MKVKAAAKINLMLDVTGTLPNGYHSLFMIMQSVDCCDSVRVDLIKGDKIKILCADKRVPVNEKNIAYKAAKAFFEYNNIENNCGIEIEIDKKIPMAAGLAGGSADAAAVIFALNRLFDTKLPLFTLCEIGESVGADVPFSLHGSTALCMGTGGVIAPLPKLENCFVVLCKPDMDISTPNAYRQIDEAPRIRHCDRNAMLYAMKTGDYELMCRKAANVFEQVIEVPVRPHIKTTMKKFGADLALMSGSGPTVFGVFRERQDACKCAERLKREFDGVFLAKPCENSIEITEE